MGLTTKRNEKGQYQIISSISNERLHKEKWISEKEAKKALINRAFWDFFHKVVEIDADFPYGYSNQGKRYMRADDDKTETGNEKILRLLKSSHKKNEAEWERLKKEYELDI